MSEHLSKPSGAAEHSKLLVDVENFSSSETAILSIIQDDSNVKGQDVDPRTAP